MRGKLCVLPREVSIVPFEKSRRVGTEFWLRIEQSILTTMEESAEGILGGKKQASSFGSMDELGTRPVIERAGVGNSRPKRKKIDVMPPLKARTV